MKHLKLIKINTLLTLMLCVCVCSACISQSSPLAFTYSGVARDESGIPINNQSIGVQINILASSAIGSSIFSENHFVNTNANGLFSLTVGSGSSNFGNIAEINWGADDYFLQVSLDISGGNNFQEVGVSQLLSVPYALHARTAESLTDGGGGFDGNYNSLLNLPQLDNVALSGDYNDLINAPSIPTVPQGISTFTNDVGFISSDNDSQYFTASSFGDTLFLSNGNWIIVPGISAANYQQGGIFSLGNGVTDLNGNEYETIIINGGEWMSENLRTSLYANGDEITNLIPFIDWYTTTSGAWSHYNNDASFDTPYGKLYNWIAATDTRNVCPTGWHVPSLEEWTQLIDFLGGWSNAGGKLKSTDEQYWTIPIPEATNESGFKGLPSGNRSDIGDYFGMGVWCIWWTSTQFTPTLIRSVTLNQSSTSVGTPNYPPGAGLPIRCKRD